MAMQAIVQNTLKVSPPLAHSDADRREFLGVLATAAISIALPVAAVGSSAAIAAESDPIFRAIEAWRTAEQSHDRLCEENEDIPEWTDAMRASCDAYHDAANKMAETVPTTLAGMAALTEIIVHEITIGDCFWHAVACASVARALRRASGGTPVADVAAALVMHAGFFEPESRPGLLEHFETAAPASHIILTAFETSQGWHIKAEASGYEPYVFGGYADTEGMAHWAARQVSDRTGATVSEGNAP